jgi:hypothetical protein
MKYAEFMHSVDLIKKLPASWMDLFFPETHSAPNLMHRAKTWGTSLLAVDGVTLRYRSSIISDRSLSVSFNVAVRTGL